jgi:hypothetical protein
MVELIGWAGWRQCRVAAKIDGNRRATWTAGQSGQRGPRGDVVHGLGDHDHLGDEAVRTGVRGVPHQVGELMQHLGFAHQVDEVFPEVPAARSSATLSMAGPPVAAGRSAPGFGSRSTTSTSAAQAGGLAAGGQRPRWGGTQRSRHMHLKGSFSGERVHWGGVQSRRTRDRSKCEVEVRLCFHRRAEGHLMHPLIHWQGSLGVPAGAACGRVAKTDAQARWAPSRSAARTRWSCVRERMFSLAKIFRRWYSTVRGLRNNRAPISGLERPSRASRAIWAS